MQRLKGKTALITGAASGIGEAIAHAFVREGAFVYVTDINSSGQAVADILGDMALFDVLDVSKESHWQQLIGKIAQHKRSLDIVVNNAGVNGLETNRTQQNPEQACLKSWRRVHRINLDGVFLGCKYAIRAMRPNKCGAIINMSSRSGLVGVPDAAAYASSKAAVRNHTKTVALYCASQGLNIRCNSIHPAAIMTPIWDPMLGVGSTRDERIKAMTAAIPLGRFGEAQEIAAVAVLLGSDEVTFMTGAELNIDGGILAGSSAQPAIE